MSGAKNAQLRDELEQAPRLARPHGHHRGAARLEGHVVGDAARVERVVEAVGDHVIWAHAGDPERLAARARKDLAERVSTLLRREREGFDRALEPLSGQTAAETLRVLAQELRTALPADQRSTEGPA